LRPFFGIQIKYTLLDRQAAPTNRPDGATMAFSEALAERIRHLLARRKHVEEKRMFGGIGFLLSGNLLVGVRKDSLLVRFGPEQSDEALKEAHVSEFNIIGRSMKGGVLVAPEGVENDDQLGGWVRHR
jgi:hypothetical protein